MSRTGSVRRSQASRHARPWAPGAFAAASLAGLALIAAATAAFALLLALVESRWGPLAVADEAIVDAANSVVSSNAALVTIARAIRLGPLVMIGLPIRLGPLVVIGLPIRPSGRPSVRRRGRLCLSRSVRRSGPGPGPGPGPIG